MYENGNAAASVCMRRKKGILGKGNREKRAGCYEVMICGKYNKNYWLIIEISENAILRELDQFVPDREWTEEKKTSKRNG